MFSRQCWNQSDALPAATAVYFTACCRDSSAALRAVFECRSPRNESARAVQEVLQAGVESYRQSAGGRLGESTRTDEVVSSQSLRIVDVRAFSRSLRYPSTLEIVISQLQQTAGSMATFLYGHGNFLYGHGNFRTLFLGFFGGGLVGHAGDAVFVVLDTRACSPDTGFPSHTGGPVMLVFTSAAELQCYLELLLQGEGGRNISDIDWQASFLEVVPPETSESNTSGRAIGSVDSFLHDAESSPSAAWLGSAHADTPDSNDGGVHIAVPEPLVSMDDVVSGHSSSSSTPSEMEELEQFMTRSSMDDDFMDPLQASMNRSSLDDLEDVLPCLDHAEAPCSLERSVQAAIQLETAKQADMAAWQAEMNARMHKSREEHERRQRTRRHSHHSHSQHPHSPPQQHATQHPAHQDSREPTALQNHE